MFTTEELKRASEIINLIAAKNHLPEEQIRAELQDAMNCGRNDPDPSVQAHWAGFHYAGPEPTAEEFVLWVSSIVRNAITPQRRKTTGQSRGLR